MNPAQQALWEKILHFELNDPQSTFPFVQRLALENGWKLWPRFCLPGHPWNTSDSCTSVVLHLPPWRPPMRWIRCGTCTWFYTRSYWHDFCRDTLQREIHHGPTKGGKTEDAKYNDCYDTTLKLYAAHFGQAAPADLWPPAQIRFAPLNFRRINLNQYWLLPKKLFGFN